MSEKDEVMPEGSWAFDEEVTKVFDNMLSRSIPQYELMRDTVYRLGKKYIQPKSMVWDLGSSTGEGLVRFVADSELRHIGANFLGIEQSDPMILEAKKRFAHHRNVQFMKLDLAREFPGLLMNGLPSLILSVLTLQFTPIEYRHRIMQRIYDHLAPGGAFILVEKVLASSARLDEDFVELYYDGKRYQGYTDEQIERKRLSLEGKLVPLTPEWNEGVLKQVGFNEIDCFWRYLNFAGWIAVKR